MRALTDREQLLQAMRAAEQQVNAALEGLTEEKASRPQSDGWSVKDHLNHMTFWHEMRFFEVSRIARGGRASFPVSDEVGVKALNEQFVSNRRGLPLSQVLADLDFAREMVRQAVAGVPENRLDERLYEEIGQTGAGHDMEHAEVIESWRKKEGI